VMNKILLLPFILLVITAMPAYNLIGTPPSSYSMGFTAGKHDTKTNLYDPTNACSADINHTDVQTYACLKGYSDGSISPYHIGYLQGVQGAELKGTHAFISFTLIIFSTLLYLGIVDWSSKPSRITATRL
jgi:hypothetical protein